MSVTLPLPSMKILVIYAIKGNIVVFAPNQTSAKPVMILSK